MKHSIYSAVFAAPNCFRTVIRDTGISRFYSVCVKDIYNLEEIAAVSGIRSCAPQTYTLSFTRVWKVVDKDLFYQQRPYKNIEYKEFKRRGRYIIVECFTSYANMNNISDALIEDSREIKSLLRIIKALYPKK